MLLVVAAVLGLSLILADRQQSADLSPDRPSAAARDEGSAATAFLPKLRARLLAAEPQQLGEMSAGRAARRELVSLAGNLDRLRVTDLELRYVDASDVELPAELRDRVGADPWVADVRLTWRFRGAEQTVSTLEVPLVLGWVDDEPAFVTARLTGDGRVPLWWQTRVAVRRTPTTLVVAAEPGRLRVLGRQVATAVATVRRTLPSWRGPAVVEAARTSGQFRSASGLSASSARAIAAVTTTADGSGLERSSSHIYLNPPVFDLLGPQGQQIVLSHEAAHVALGAATRSVPMWLSEGLADYVALVDSEVPVPVLAAQARALVREEGAPARLPGREEFDGANEDIGAWYEAAWLAVALIAERYGEEALLEFYRVTDEDGSSDRAFHEVLGTTEEAFVDAWRAELTALAG